jgi:hypothetical protein
MVAKKIAPFSGMLPILDDRNIPDDAAALSQNAFLYAGTLQGMRTPTPVHVCSTPQTAKVFRIPNNFLDPQHVGDSIWVEFTDINTDVLRSPIVGDTFDRYYIASSSVQPLYNTAARLTAGNSGANAPFILGVPAPSAAPTMIVAGGSSTIIQTRSYVYTWVSAYGEEGPPSPPIVQSGKIDATWQVFLGLPAAGDLGTNRNLTKANVYRTVTSVLGIATYFLVASIPIGITTNVNEHSNTTLDGIVPNAQTYVGVGFGVAGAHIPGGATVVNVNSPTQVTISGAATQTGTESVSFLPIVTDTAADSAITGNAILPSTTWAAPPTDLQGFVTMPNGMIAGWRQKEVWFCEPYRPHAWPAQYAVAVDYPIVGLGVVGQTLVVCTEGNPYALTGVHPLVITQSRLGSLEPCMSRGSVVSSQTGVFYCSPNGIILITQGMVVNATKKLASKDRWLQLNTALPTLHAAFAQGAYYGWGTARGGVFGASLAAPSFEATAFQQQDLTGANSGLYVDSQNDGVRYNVLFNTDPMFNVFNDPWTGDVLLIRDNTVYQLDFSSSGLCVDQTVQFLCTCDGTNGSKVFTDLSINAAPITTNGTAQVSTAKSVFGGASAVFDGSANCALSVADAPQFDPASDFTIDFWFNAPTLLGTAQQIINKRNNGNVPQYAFLMTAGNHLQVSVSSNGVANDIFNAVDLGLVTANQWNHVALVRSTATGFYYAFVNGALIQSTANTNPPFVSSNSLFIGGRQDGTLNFFGYIDEIRFSNVARWTAAFLVPTVAYGPPVAGPFDAFVWKSKIFQTPARKNIAAMRVYFDVPPGTAVQSATRVTDQTALQTLQTGQYGIVYVYADEVQVVARELRTTGELMHIPSGFKANYWQFVITGVVNVKSLEWATTAKELAKI